MKKVSGKVFREHQNTHFMFKNFFFRKLCSLLDNVKKYCRAAKPHDNMTHAHCILDI